MSYNFHVLIEGDYACFTRPELKVERVSYDVPTPGALEGLLKSIYWKPAMRYVIDRIYVFHPIQFLNIRRNEVKGKVPFRAMKGQMNGTKDPFFINASKSRSQRAAMILKDVKYGVSFHIETTGLRCRREVDGAKKHADIFRRRAENGQWFRVPCLGCSEFPVRKISLAESIDTDQISEEIRNLGDVDLGYMSYKVQFKDQGRPVNNDWDHPVFSDEAVTCYYRPHMISGVIDVEKYREGLRC